MKTILVPTDFSPNADKALDYAVQLAKKLKAKIILVHACDLLELTFKDKLWLKKEYNKNIIREANEKLSLYCKSIQEEEKINIRKKLYNGLVTDTILHAVKDNKADLVVMGTLGNSGIKERILGSKTAGIIGKIDIPVLAIPLLGEWKTPGNILFTIRSFSEGEKETVESLVQLAGSFQSKINVVKFSDPADASPHKQLTIWRAGERFTRKLQGMAPGIIAQFAHLASSRFEKDVEKYIARNGVDMLAMISHKRNVTKSLFHRNLTKKMAYHAKVPLLALPA